MHPIQPVNSRLKSREQTHNAHPRPVNSHCASHKGGTEWPADLKAANEALFLKHFFNTLHINFTNLYGPTNSVTSYQSMPDCALQTSAERQTSRTYTLQSERTPVRCSGFQNPQQLNQYQRLLLLQNIAEITLEDCSWIPTTSLSAKLSKLDGTLGTPDATTTGSKSLWF
jgi:hypothetical protein